MKIFLRKNIFLKNFYGKIFFLKFFKEKKFFQNFFKEKNFFQKFFYKFFEIFLKKSFKKNFFLKNFFPPEIYINRRICRKTSRFWIKMLHADAQNRFSGAKSHLLRARPELFCACRRHGTAKKGILRFAAKSIPPWLGYLNVLTHNSVTI